MASGPLPLPPRPVSDLVGVVWDLPQDELVLPDDHQRRQQQFPAVRKGGTRRPTRCTSFHRCMSATTCRYSCSPLQPLRLEGPRCSLDPQPGNRRQKVDLSPDPGEALLRPRRRFRPPVPGKWSGTDHRPSSGPHTGGEGNAARPGCQSQPDKYLRSGADIALLHEHTAHREIPILLRVLAWRPGTTLVEPPTS